MLYYSYSKLIFIFPFGYIVFKAGKKKHSKIYVNIFFKHERPEMDDYERRKKIGSMYRKIIVCFLYLFIRVNCLYSAHYASCPITGSGGVAGTRMVRQTKKMYYFINKVLFTFISHFFSYFSFFFLLFFSVFSFLFFTLTHYLPFL